MNLVNHFRNVPFAERKRITFYKSLLHVEYFKYLLELIRLDECDWDFSVSLRFNGEKHFKDKLNLSLLLR